jgi:hypothetical protein
LPPALQNASITLVEADATTGHIRLVDVDRVEHLADVGLSGSGDL